jgi:hypothetical protein
MAQLRAGTWARLCISRTVLDRDSHTCRYRGQLADTLDHVIAKMDGDRDDPNNLVGVYSLTSTSSYCRDPRIRTWSARRADTCVTPRSASVDLTSWTRMSAARPTPRSPPAISP